MYLTSCEKLQSNDNFNNGSLNLSQETQVERRRERDFGLRYFFNANKDHVTRINYKLYKMQQGVTFACVISNASHYFFKDCETEIYTFVVDSYNYFYKSRFSFIFFTFFGNIRQTTRFVLSIIIYIYIYVFYLFEVEDAIDAITLMKKVFFKKVSKLACKEII